MRNWVSRLFSLAPPAALLCAVGAAPASAATCESLTGLALPQVTITAAQSIPAGTFTAPGGQRFADLPAFCRVSAFATPTPKSHIGFEVWMPASGWNQKFEGNGSGGSAGAIGYAPMANALKHNFATIATDNGHIGSSWTFADPPERIVDFGGRALHLSTIAGKAITAAFYGAAAKGSYYIGCSQGGHHGLMEAQRFDPLKFDFDKDVQYADIKEAAEGKTWAEALSADNPDLSAFKARGGKLIVYHGFADPFVTPYGILSYYAAVVDAMKKGGKDGLGETRDFARLFMAPGLNHCSGGPGANVFNGATRGAPEDPDHDVFLALSRWVETGAPPNRIVATKFNNDKPGDGVAFTRPLCPYPEVAKYKGSGDPNSAASFACVAALTGGSTPKYSDIIAPRRTGPR